MGERGARAAERRKQRLGLLRPSVRPPSVQGRAKAEGEGEEREGLTVESKLARSLSLSGKESAPRPLRTQTDRAGPDYTDILR